MAYHPEFLNFSNFELAFKRLVYAQNYNYKVYYEHLLSSYQLALKGNLFDLISEVQHGTYEPGKPLIIYLPKESAVLRPITILSLRDLILYQAIINNISLRMAPLQVRHALTRTFGAVLNKKDGGPMEQPIRRPRVPERMTPSFAFSYVERAFQESLATRSFNRRDVEAVISFFEMQTLECVYCGNQDVRRWDHLIPVALGGETVLGNMVPSSQGATIPNNIFPIRSGC